MILTAIGAKLVAAVLLAPAPADALATPSHPVDLRVVHGATPPPRELLSRLAERLSTRDGPIATGGASGGEHSTWVATAGDPASAGAWLLRWAFAPSSDDTGTDPRRAAPFADLRDAAGRPIIIAVELIPARGELTLASFAAALTDAGFSAGDLMVERAPLFALPAGVIPGRAQAHGVLERTDEVWIGRPAERCGATGTCLQWVRVLARRGDLVQAGWIPAFHVATRGEWSPAAASLPRVALRPSLRDAAGTTFLLLARDGAGVLRRRSVRVGSAGAAVPSVRASVEGDRIRVTAGAREALVVELPLGPPLDARSEPPATRARTP